MAFSGITLDEIRIWQLKSPAGCLEMFTDESPVAAVYDTKTRFSSETLRLMFTVASAVIEDMVEKKVLSVMGTEDAERIRFSIAD